MKTARLWIFILPLILVISVQAQTPWTPPPADTASYTYSLQQCVDFAIAHNTSLQNALLDQKTAHYKVKEVIGIGLPQVNASFQLQDFLEIPTSLIPGEFFGGPAGSFIPVQFGTKYNATASLTATQLVFNGSYLYGIKGAQVYQELSLKNVDRTRIETVADVTKAYYTAMINAERKTLIDANLDKIRKLKEDTKILYDNGFVEKIDLDRITVAYNNAITESDNIRRLLDLSLVLLKYQMGMDQPSRLALADNLSTINFQPAKAASEKFDYTRRVEYQLMDLQLRGRVLTLKAERSGYFPTVAVFGSYQAQAQRMKFNIFDSDERWYPIALIGLQVNLPVFDGLQRHYRIQQANVGILRAQNDLIFMRRTIDMQQAVARVNLQNTAASLENQRANIELAESVLDVAQKKYGAGSGTNLEIINAQTALKEAQTNYFNALYDAMLAKVEYDKAMGLFSR
ncbi:MAG TPA: TolC family protein [Bacteroidia bacterium]|nr:TolC family protein [Bacteroidia bacterium]